MKQKQLKFKCPWCKKWMATQGGVLPEHKRDLVTFGRLWRHKRCPGSGKTPRNSWLSCQG